jgi:hypothetical protein
MVKSFKESHAKDLEKLVVDRHREAGQKATDDFVNAPKHTVLSMTGLTSPVWTLGMFQMVTGEFCQCIQHTKQTDPCHVGVRHALCTVSKLYEVILKFVKQIQAWGDTRIKKLQQMTEWSCLEHTTLLLSLQKKRLAATCFSLSCLICE